MNVYICGKITGLPIDEAMKRFEEAELRLRSRGFDVVNPMKLPHQHDKSWKAYMKECVHHLFDCDAIYPIFDGIEDSAGAQLELSIARSIGIELLHDINIEK